MKTIHTVYAVSVVIHVAGAVALNLLDPPKQVEVVNVTMTTVQAPEKKEEPKPPEPAPEAAPRPAPRAAPKAAAEPPPEAAPPPAPDFGFVMGGGGGAGGIAVGPKVATPAPPKTVKKLVAAAAVTTEAPCAEADTKPKATSMPHPAYTEEARAAAIEGKVRVELSLTAEGTVADAKVLEGLGHGLDEAAIAALRGATFQPATRCGKPVAATFTVSVRFTL